MNRPQHIHRARPATSHWPVRDGASETGVRTQIRLMSQASKSIAAQCGYAPIVLRADHLSKHPSKARSQPSRPTRALFCRAAALGAVAVGVLLLAPISAMAATSHIFSGTLGGETSTVKDPYPISDPTDIAVNQASGDIYVADPGSFRIEKFDSQGDFLLMFGKEVNKTKVEEAEEPGNPHHITEAEQYVCTAESHDECQPGTKGSTPNGECDAGAFESSPYRIAVDNTPSGEGDVYVNEDGEGDSQTFLQKFNSSGNSILSWNRSGCLTFSVGGAGPVAVGPTGNLYAIDDGALSVYNSEGIKLPFGSEVSPEAVDSEGNLYGTHDEGLFKADPAGNLVGPITLETPTTGFALDPSLGDFYRDTGIEIDHYNCEPAEGPCSPIDSFGSSDLFDPGAVAVAAGSGTVYVVNVGASDVAAFEDIRPEAKTLPPSGIAETAATLMGQVDPENHGKDHGSIVKCRFEFGASQAYGQTAPCFTGEPGDETEAGTVTNPITSTSQTEVHTDLTGLTHLSNLPPGTHFHYRLFVENENDAIGLGHDEAFLTSRAPAIKGLAAGELTATSAHISAVIDPDGLTTSYRVEYGVTSKYGNTEPVPDGDITGNAAELNSDHSIEVRLNGLQSGITYHYRLVAENADGTTSTSDDTFAFFPPTCPNEALRQQTHAPYLPDCRAYELVSPANAGSTQLAPGGPNTGYATSPSRLAFVGSNGTLPDSGGSPIDAKGDLYVATRTQTGWVSRYIGLPASEAAVDGGPPQGIPGSGGGDLEIGSQPSGAAGPGKVQNGVFTDSSMDAFLEFNDGNQGVGAGHVEANPNLVSSNAPYVYGADGTFLERWPTDLGAASPGDHALDCLTLEEIYYNDCPGDVTASSDLHHFIFATETHLFAPQGQLSAPGSVYDNNTLNSTVQVASQLPGGEAIPSQPADHSGDPLQIPAVSGDGSHILMAAGGTGPCGTSTCPVPPCGEVYDDTVRCPMQPSNLYMRVNDSVTYDVSQGHDVTYIGMTSDGSSVYFASEEHLTQEDQYHGGADLYMWSEAGELTHHPLTLISKGAGEERANPGIPQLAIPHFLRSTKNTK